jgi:hypothetical protein
MNFTINDVDQVIERTGCSYREAKDALTQANGDVVDAIIYLENRERSSFNSFFKGVSEETERTTDSIVNTIKAAIKEGNVTKIEVRNADGKKMASVSVNTGVAIGGIALIAGAAPLVVISALVTKFGLNYQFVIVKKDGSEIVL